jgi:hypothetical protein
MRRPLAPNEGVRQISAMRAREKLERRFARLIEELDALARCV